ncbi:MAG TPA: hypothetical protein VK669_14880 [Candidatus Limnocylindrales bacterium]|nr:hypothetical protein [Candidatus Limnocylindrales bacterium]
MSACLGASPAATVTPSPAATPQTYIEAKGLGVAAAARILNAQYTSPGKVRISYTDRGGHEALLLTQTAGADYFAIPDDRSDYPSQPYSTMAFYAVPGETNPLLRVTVSAAGGRNVLSEDVYVTVRNGSAVRVPVIPLYAPSQVDADAKPISGQQHFVNPLQTLHFRRLNDVVGGGSLDGFAQYFVRLSGGKAAILQTTWLLKDLSTDHAAPQPEPTIAASTCYRLYTENTVTFFANCSAR